MLNEISYTIVKEYLTSEVCCRIKEPITFTREHAPILPSKASGSYSSEV